MAIEAAAKALHDRDQLATEPWEDIDDDHRESLMIEARNAIAAYDQARAEVSPEGRCGKPFPLQTTRDLDELPTCHRPRDHDGRHEAQVSAAWGDGQRWTLTAYEGRESKCANCGAEPELQMVCENCGNRVAADDGLNLSNAHGAAEVSPEGRGEWRVRLIAAREIEVGDLVWAEERGFLAVTKVKAHPLIGVSRASKSPSNPGWLRERSGDVDVWVDDSEHPWMLADGMCPLLIRAAEASSPALSATVPPSGDKGQDRRIDRIDKLALRVAAERVLQSARNWHAQGPEAEAERALALDGLATALGAESKYGWKVESVAPSDEQGLRRAAQEAQKALGFARSCIRSGERETEQAAAIFDSAQAALRAALAESEARGA